jgi:hypothetical protein
MVADAGGEGALSPATAWVGLLAFVIGLALLVVSSRYTQLSNLVPMEKSPDVLVNEARRILELVGFEETPVDSTCGFDTYRPRLDYLLDERDPEEHFELLRAGWPAVHFWYRQSSSLLVPLDRTRIAASLHDPPQTRPGMAHVMLDPDGRLRRLWIIAPLVETMSEASPEPDWSPLLQAAKLDPEALRRSTPKWTRPISTDSRIAWETTLPVPFGIPLHIEAASFHGRPVLFETFWPWEKPPETGSSQKAVSETIAEWVSFGGAILLLAGVALMARRNLKLGRCHRKAAFRLAMLLLGLSMAAWLVGGHHLPSQVELELLFGHLGASLFVAAVAWTMYLALEPHFRRFWPRQLVSWIRLLDGRVRDPLVGRDILFGGLFGVLIALVHDLHLLVPRWLGTTLPPLIGLGSPANRLRNLFASLRGTRFAVSEILLSFVEPVLVALAWAALLALAYLLLRKRWLAVVVLMLFLVANGLTNYGPRSILFATSVVLALIVVFVLARFGVLVMAIAVAVSRLVSAVPVTLDLSKWYAGGTIAAYLLLLGIAVYGFYTSVGGQRVFRDGVLDG